MGCVQSYFKRAHNAGVSPSSTQESNSKQPPSEDGTRNCQEGQSITEEPESNDTSYGVEATAVRTLAASTGTVAILGTTAKTGDKRDDKDKGGVSPGVSETILEAEEQEEGGTSVEKAEVHEEVKTEVTKRQESSEGSKAATSNSRPTSQLEESVSKNEESIDVSTPPSSSNTIKENHTNDSPNSLNKSPISNSPKSEVTSPEVKSPTDEVPEPISTSEPVAIELQKEKEEDLSKSISSERLKTNSISNTTLSSDSIAEFENGSVKQSPSVDKVVESFDSSSTVEFVDHLKNSAKDDKTNPARSISSDLSNKVNLPVDGEKTPDVTSPEVKEEKDEVDDLPLPPPPETNGLSEISNFEEVPKDQEKTEESYSKDVTNDEISVSEVSSNVSSSVQSVVRNDSNVNGENSKSAMVNGSSNVSEDKDKAETGSPLSSDNNSSFNDNGDAASPVIAVILSPAPPKEPVANHKEETKLEKTNSISPEKDSFTPTLTNGTNLTNESNNHLEKNHSIENSINDEISNSIEIKALETQVNGKDIDDLRIDLSDEKVVAAATTIQASFRGFQTRQTLKVEKGDNKNENSTVETNFSETNNSLEELKATPDSVRETANEIVDAILEEVDEKMVQAATTIQANFRGFQTRQTLKSKLDSGLPPSEDLNQSDERSPTVLTPELIESVKEEVDDICKEAEIIAAERAESADGMKGVQQVVVGVKEYGLPSVSSIKAVRGSVTPPSVSEACDLPEEVFDSLTEVDEKTINAATTIQATFRGFQARKQLQNKEQDISDVSKQT